MFLMGNINSPDFINILLFSWKLTCVEKLVLYTSISFGCMARKNVEKQSPTGCNVSNLSLDMLCVVLKSFQYVFSKITVCHKQVHFQSSLCRLRSKNFWSPSNIY